MGYFSFLNYAPRVVDGIEYNFREEMTLMKGQADTVDEFRGYGIQLTQYI